MEKGDEIPLVTATQVTPVPGGTVEVTAPMDLQEGYTLQVSVNGQVQSVRVPPGGVKEGDSFQAEPMDGGNAHLIPHGQWRDGCCDCFTFGCCHSMCCLGYWFHPILAGQVMTRMSRDFFGGPGPRPSVSNTCKIVTCIFIVVSIIDMVLGIVADSSVCFGATREYNVDTGKWEIQCLDGTVQEPNMTYTATSGVAGAIVSLFGLYIIIGVCRTRYVIRNKYNIRADACGGCLSACDGRCEDFCCSLLFPCCTLQQMARHTNDYANYDVKCCSDDCWNKRGQQPHLPEIDV